MNGSATFRFTECSAVNNIKIKFKQAGQSPVPDIENNYIPNAKGDIMAKGVAVKDKIMSVSVGENQISKDLTLNAQVISVNKTGEGISPGMLQTAIGMEISYE